MAALDGKITIERGLRPCIVHIPEKRQNYRKKGDNLNVYDKVVEPEKNIKALFHCWNYRSELVGESYLSGGHPARQISATFALVEYEDGTIHEVEPTQIRFVDNAMSEYLFPEVKSEKEKSFDALRGICPKCGAKMRIDGGIVFTSNPPQYRYKCEECGHIEHTGIKVSVDGHAFPEMEE